MMKLLLSVALVIPLGLDRYLPAPESNPVTADQIALGRRLFFDTRLSRDRSVSCASCHQPSRAFSDGRTVAVGISQRIGRRNVPALINRGYGRAFFWDARALTLEEQVLQPIEDRNEMDLAPAEAAQRVGLTPTQLSNALATFVRSILSGNSPYDQFIAGMATALNAEQQAGLRLFRGKGNCTACHVGPNLTDERLHNTGVAWQPGAMVDTGAGQGRFKTPTLREISLTAPYMHDGSLAELGDVIDFYDRGGQANSWLDPEIRPLGLSAGEKSQLVSFLRALNGQ
jgi:cytochrome c peroxidase